MPRGPEILAEGLQTDGHSNMPEGLQADGCTDGRKFFPPSFWAVVKSPGFNPGGGKGKVLKRT